MMRFDVRPSFAALCVAALFAVLLALSAAPAQAQSFSDAQRGEIERIVKDYLLSQDRKSTRLNSSH